ncbi:FAD-binding oxidoreductase [Nonomuraea sp. NPDC046570]|uniref:FAD-binding oxidoreductase n=1 Tax=Nonomuraea sp. NPDC046570 TaxID=3155255 RepID=UPI0033D72333
MPDYGHDLMFGTFITPSAHRGVQEALPASLRGKAIAPGDAAYPGVRHSYSWPGSPALVLRPENADEVVTALAYVRAQELPLAVRSGGHGISGRSTNDGGIVIDLAELNRVEVLDRASGRVRLEPGARWGEVARKLAPYGLAMSSGDSGGVGVGGLTTTGGIGYLARKHGLTIDHVTAVEMVLADGTQVRADRDHHPDLFWAVRGAGGNFGVVTAFELEAYEVGDVVYAGLVVDATETAAFLRRWGRLVEEAPREITSFLTLAPARGGNPPVAQMTLVYAGDEVEAAQDALSPFLGAGPVLDQQAAVVPYPELVRASGQRHEGHGLAEVRSGLVEHVTPEIAAGVEGMLHAGDTLFTQFRSVGGAVNDVPAQATAYPHRTQNFSLLAATVPVLSARLNKRWEALREHLNGLYLSFETDTSPERLADAFPEPALSRLRALKQIHDPDNVFNGNFPIR